MNKSEAGGVGAVRCSVKRKKKGGRKEGRKEGKEEGVKRI